MTDATYRPQGPADNETAILYGIGSSIEVVLESGEHIDSWQPPIAKPVDYAIWPVWSPDGSRVYYMAPSGIYSIAPSAPTVPTTVIPLASGLKSYCLSPDGLKIAYTRTPVGEMDTEVFVRDIAGGATKRLTTNASDDAATCWIDNERVAVNNLNEVNGTKIVRVSDLSQSNYGPYDGKVYPYARSQDGLYFLNSGANDPAVSGFSVTQFAGGIPYGAKDYFDKDTQIAMGASISPNGKRWLFSSEDGLFSTQLMPSSLNRILPAGPTLPFGVSWQPAMGVTKFVGSGGKLGASSAGIVATRRSGLDRNGLSSFLTWDCQTRSTSTISEDATDSGAGSKTYTLEADKLTSLNYANRPFFLPTSILSAGSLANGAMVSVDTSSGLVRSVVIYQETRGTKPTIRRNGAGKVIEGHLLGIWDAKGRDLAPQGASRVALSETGEPQR